MDYRDYLVDQAKQREVTQRVEALVGDPAEDVRSQENAVRSHAVNETVRLAQEADAIDDEYREIREDVLAVRDDAKHQRISSAQAVARLQSLRRKYDALHRRYKALQVSYATATETSKDPAARRAALLDKYPNLR